MIVFPGWRVISGGVQVDVICNDAPVVEDDELVFRTGDQVIAKFREWSGIVRLRPQEQPALGELAHPGRLFGIGQQGY